MEKIDYKTLFELVEKYDEEVSRIFNKLKNACQLARVCIIRYGYYSNFERIEWKYSDENSIIVRYYDQACNLYDGTALKIPADILFDDEKIDEWIKSEVDEALEKKELERKAVKKQQEEKERQAYDCLKEKYEKYNIHI